MKYLFSRATGAEVEWIGSFVLLDYFPEKPEPCKSYGIPFRSSSRRAGRTQKETRVGPQGLRECLPQASLGSTCEGA